MRWQFINHYLSHVALHMLIIYLMRSIGFDAYLSGYQRGLSTCGITPWHILSSHQSMTHPLIILAFRWLGLGGHQLNRSWTWWHYGRAGDAGMTHHGVTGRQSRKSNVRISSPSSDTRSNGTRSRNGNRYTIYISHWNVLQVSHWSRSPRSSTASWEFGSGSCDHATLTDMPNSSWSNVINGRSCPQSYAWQASDITALLTSSSSTWAQCVAYDDQVDFPILISDGDDDQRHIQITLPYCDLLWCLIIVSLDVDIALMLILVNSTYIVPQSEWISMLIETHHIWDITILRKHKFKIWKPKK
jgi:hypothetical protein